MTLVAPFYKGLVHLESKESIALITKRDPVTGNEISDERYIQIVREATTRATELVQDIARASAAALLAAHQKQEGVPSRLITVEGCPQIVGGQPMVGADIMESIWSHVVPREVMSVLPSPIIERTSDCTVREVRTILSHLQGGGTVQGVTHEYHQPRVEKILREEAAHIDQIPDVLTPEQIIKSIGNDQPSHRFIAALVNAGAPSSETVTGEHVKEKLIYEPLHIISRLGEKLTNGTFNLEMFMAKIMRK